MFEANITEQMIIKRIHQSENSQIEIMTNLFLSLCYACADPRMLLYVGLVSVPLDCVFSFPPPPAHPRAPSAPPPPPPPAPGPALRRPLPRASLSVCPVQQEKVASMP